MNRFHLRARYGAFELDAAAQWEAPAAALFGASGSGKTTIVEALAGLRPEVQGEVTLSDRRLEDVPARRRHDPLDDELLHRFTIVLKPPQNIRFASKGIFFGSIISFRRLSAMTSFRMRSRSLRDL